MRRISLIAVLCLALPTASASAQDRVSAVPERSPSSELERPPPPAPLKPPPPSGPFARIALGAGVALLTDGELSDLRLPSYAHLDLGYAFSPEFALTARLGTWLSFSPFALDFIGAGASFGFAPESMFVTALIGLSFADDAFFVDGSDLQGLAVHLDLGQRWTVTGQLYFELGAHFELGTPLLTNSEEFVSIGIGPFVSVRWGG